MGLGLVIHGVGFGGAGVHKFKMNFVVVFASVSKLWQCRTNDTQKLILLSVFFKCIRNVSNFESHNDLHVIKC